MAFYRCGGGADTSAVTATADDVLAPKVIIGADGEEVVGTIPTHNIGTVTLGSGSSYRIEKGFHEQGMVVVKGLSDQTPGTAAAGDIVSGRTAWVNGKKVTGTRSSDIILPDAIRNLAVVELNAGLKLTWELPENSEVSISSLRVYICDSDTEPASLAQFTLKATLSPTTTAYTISGLMNNNRYYVLVESVGSNGYGNATMREVSFGTPFVTKLKALGITEGNNGGGALISCYNGKNWAVTSSLPKVGNYMDVYIHYVCGGSYEILSVTSYDKIYSDTGQYISADTRNTIWTKHINSQEWVLTSGETGRNPNAVPIVYDSKGKQFIYQDFGPSTEEVTDNNPYAYYLPEGTFEWKKVSLAGTVYTVVDYRSSVFSCCTDGRWYFNTPDVYYHTVYVYDTSETPGVFVYRGVNSYQGSTSHSYFCNGGIIKNYDSSLVYGGAKVISLAVMQDTAYWITVMAKIEGYSSPYFFTIKITSIAPCTESFHYWYVPETRRLYVATFNTANNNGISWGYLTLDRDLKTWAQGTMPAYVALPAAVAGHAPRTHSWENEVIRISNSYYFFSTVKDSGKSYHPVYRFDVGSNSIVLDNTMAFPVSNGNRIIPCNGFTQISN